MKKALFFFVFTLLVFCVKAQTTNAQKLDTIDKIKPVDTANLVYTAVESEAEFPGGRREFFKYLGQNINVPSDQFVKGQVVVSFVIDLDGKVIETNIVKGVVTDGMRKEIIRVFNSSPKWKPAIQNSKPVRIQYSIPLNF